MRNAHRTRQCCQDDTRNDSNKFSDEHCRDNERQASNGLVSRVGGCIYGEKRAEKKYEAHRKHTRSTYEAHFATLI